MTTSVTADLADLVVDLTPTDLGGGTLDLVEMAFVDTIGCVLAGSMSDEARLASAWAVRMGGHGDCTVIGASERLPAAFAALVNATAGHALDLDDVSPTMTHPSTCLVPPLLAVAERERASGEQLMMAYVAGFEVCVRLCRIINPDHYYRGWHSMGTVNGLGVAAGVARLLGLDNHGVRTAMAIASASSSGIRKNFGTMVKPLHAGQAAYHGVQAAELAAAGFTADDAVLDGPHGFFDVFANGTAVPTSFERRPLELELSGIIVKRYACCGALHPAIDALVELVDGHAIEPAAIAGITCAVNARALHVLVHHQASTPAEGRFSVEYTLAVAAIDRDAGPTQYTTERVADEAVQRLSRAVTVVVDDELPTGYALFPAIVTVNTVDGRSFTLRRDLAQGDPSLPFGADDIVRKFRGCAAFVLDDAGAARAEAAVLALRDADDVAKPIGSLGG